MAVAEKPLYYLSIHEAQQLIKDHKLSPVELTRAVLDRIAAVDEQLHAYINLMADSALQERARRRRRFQRQMARADARIPSR